ncbi:MAG: type IIL restriction-modification enzyme MmeI [Parasphingorhabdus flavimaris]|uniref:type IIL restriction-modification enzyme MmeI n=1 Tax=Sphingorhabdus sp. YGSMI21 TaxID=2077182 RepID=UPI002D1E4919|nr:type IIL restriction-modification enzyme MmeI [uncultured Parasphingorhabdus sp.]
MNHFMARLIFCFFAEDIQKAAFVDLAMAEMVYPSASRHPLTWIRCWPRECGATSIFGSRRG